MRALLRKTAIGFGVLCIAFGGCAGEDTPASGDTVVNDSASATDTSEGVSDTTATNAPDVQSGSDVSLPDVTGSILRQGLFQAIDVPGDPNQVFYSCWTEGTTRAYLSGTKGSIVGWNGLIWKELSSGLFTTLNGIAAGKDGLRAHAVGLNGTVVSGQALSKQTVAQTWGPPGGCQVATDCDDKDECTNDYCESGICQHTPSGSKGCCGSIAFSDSFANMANWTVTDIYQQVVDQGGIVWSAAAITGKDNKPRYTSAPSAMYFGRLDKPCAFDSSKVCGTFDNGKVVGSRARSPLFQVPVSESVKLTFQLLLDVENGTGFDVLTLHVKQGSKKTLVWDKQSIGGSGKTDGKFITQQVDLTKWAGVSIELEWSFDAKQKDLNDGEGVFIDDLSIMTTCASGSSAVKGLTKSSFFDVWAYGDDLAYAVGVNGAIAKWNGDEWKMQTDGKPQEIYALGGVAGVLQLIAGQSGLLGTLSTAGIDSVSDSTIYTLYDVAVTENLNGKTHALAVGAAGTVLEYDGTQWALKPFPTKATIKAVTSAGGGVYYAIAGSLIYERSSLGTWSMKAAASTILNDIAATGAGQAIAVGGAGLMMQRSGGVWQPKPGTFGVNNAYAIHVNGPKDIWVVGDNGMVANFTGGTQWQGIKVPTGKHLRGVWASAPDNVWVVGLAGTMLRFNEGKWATIAAPIGTADFSAIWGSDPNDIYAAAQGGLLLRWDGLNWKVIAAPVTQTLRAVWGTGPTDVWAVGDKGAIFHNTGGGWSPTPVDPFVIPEQDPYIVESTLHAIWGNAPDDIWATGAPDADGRGVMVHYDGKSWKYTQILVDEQRTIRAIWGWDASRMLLVGTQGMTMGFDGKNLTELDTGSISTFHDVCGWGKDALLVGSVGTVLRYIPPLSQSKAEETKP
ncbi:MAG: hypothetical protein CMH53_09300 [Myxococcales bacterium]|nr:hypothetical protein [Myxococcales bacterium]